MIGCYEKCSDSGRNLFADGAIEASQLTRDGRHSVAADSASWHLLTVDSENRVRGVRATCPIRIRSDLWILVYGRARWLSTTA